MEERETLLTELAANGVKHTPENVVATGRDWTGRIVFLEQEVTEPKVSGLIHILTDHGKELAQRSIAPSYVPELLMQTLARGRIVSTQGTNEGNKVPRPIFEAQHGQRKYHIGTTVGSNGYIVGINFRSDPEQE